MDAVTYPNSSLIDFVQKNMIPLQMSSDTQPFSTDFKIKWIPTLITLDPDHKKN
jgi:hypothetical protein